VVDTTSDLGRERAYVSRLWAAQCSEALHVTATEFFIFRATEKSSAPLNAASGARAVHADHLFRLLTNSRKVIVFTFLVPLLGPNYPVYGPNYPVYGPNYPVYGPNYTVYGPNYPVYGPNYPVYGPNYPVYGPNYTVYGPNYTVYGPNFASFGSTILH